MKRAISLAVALLLAPTTDAVQLRSMVKFPVMPSGDAITRVISAGLEEGKREVAKAMYEERQWCDDQRYGMKEGQNGKGGAQQNCETWEEGLRPEMDRANRDLKRAMEEAGIDFSTNTYNPKFITDLITFEYNDFVTQFNAHREQVAGDLDGALAGLTAEANNMGLAQVSLVNVAQEKAKLQSKAKAKGRTLLESRGGGRGACDDAGRQEPQQCPPDQTPETMVCPGECCWRGPESPEEEAAFNKFWDDKYQAERQARTDCMTQEPFTAMVNAALPPSDQMTMMASGAIQEVVAEFQRPQNIEELTNIISGVNHILLSEAERLSVPDVPVLPDPTDTAQKISKFMLWVGTQAASPDGQEEITRTVEHTREEIVNTAYDTSTNIEQETGISLTDPQAPNKLLQFAKDLLMNGDLAHDIGHLAEGISEVDGVSTSEREITNFATDTIDSLQNLMKAGPKPEDMAMDAEHQVEEIAGEAIEEGIREIEQKA